MKTFLSKASALAMVMILTSMTGCGSNSSASTETIDTTTSTKTTTTMETTDITETETETETTTTVEEVTEEVTTTTEVAKTVVTYDFPTKSSSDGTVYSSGEELQQGVLYEATVVYVINANQITFNLLVYGMDILKTKWARLLLWKLNRKTLKVASATL